MSEVGEAVKKYLAEKFDSPFYSSVIGSWCAWNWKIFYITLFVDSDLLWYEKGILKIDYITNFYSWTNHPVYTLLHVVVAPFLSALVIMYPLPWVARHFYRRSLDIKNSNELVAVEKSEELLTAKKRGLDAARESLKVEQQTQDVVQEAKKNAVKSQRESWEREYQKLAEDRLFKEHINNVADSIQMGRRLDNVPSYAVSFFLSNDLIDSSNNGIFTFSTKGKYFLKRHMDNFGK